MEKSTNLNFEAIVYHIDIGVVKRKFVEREILFMFIIVFLVNLAL